MYNPFIMANTRGIPRIEAISANATATDLIYNFNDNGSFGNRFAGLIIVKLPTQPAGVTGTFPVRFNSSTNANSNGVPLTTLGGAAVTAAQVTASGIYLAFYDSNNGQLQLLTGALT